MAKSSAAPAHTPLPWKFNGGSIVGHWEDGQEIQVALLTNPKWSTGPGYDETSAANARACNERMRSEAPANAQLIIKAVAAHQALYEALSAAVSSGAFEYHNDEPSSHCAVCKAYWQARAALALADAAQGEK